jgi:hypothetical protein
MLTPSSFLSSSIQEEVFELYADSLSLNDSFCDWDEIVIVVVIFV